MSMPRIPAETCPRHAGRLATFAALTLLVAIPAHAQKKPPVNCNNNGGPTLSGADSTAPLQAYVTTQVHVTLGGHDVKGARVTFQSSAGKTIQVRTDAHGLASKSLAVGSYAVTAERHGSKATATLPAGQAQIPLELALTK